MAYQVHDESSCTLTADERAAEAKRILERIWDAADQATNHGARWPSTAMSLEFVNRKLTTSWILWHTVSCSIKELFWLRLKYK